VTRARHQMATSIPVKRSATPSSPQHVHSPPARRPSRRRQGRGGRRGRRALHRLSSRCSLTCATDCSNASGSAPRSFTIFLRAVKEDMVVKMRCGEAVSWGRGERSVRKRELIGGGVAKRAGTHKESTHARGGDARIDMASVLPASLASPGQEGRRDEARPREGLGGGGGREREREQAGAEGRPAAPFCLSLSSRTQGAHPLRGGRRGGMCVCVARERGWQPPGPRRARARGGMKNAPV